ncbi:MAG: toll/interleukin-1 receptor domain-containing protein [Proteobacteria bacterium]|nr:toll/interleukin-1 receptor domain-containing protein [Pseudomonadota bacterium]MCG2749827.1 toll/interleukin-1 receptor domain-containing protein [Desulfobulbaceae bacterium]
MAAQLLEEVMSDAKIRSFIEKNETVESLAREAAKWLLYENPMASSTDIVKAVDRLLIPLRDRKLRVFFSYRSEDESIALQIAKWLEDWSGSILEVELMARFGIKQVGLDWRKKIEETIPKCEWFLLLLPIPSEQGNEKDWVLFEAGYFKRGQGLSGRFVLLHHPESEVADVLGKDQSVPAESAKVESFLKGLFHEPNWVPGMPPINSKLSDLRSKADQIVALIHQRPATSSVRFCCGPHMEVAFDDASEVTGWQQLHSGRVIDSNDDCKRLFNLLISPRLFGDWLKDVEGGRHEEGWVKELAEAVQHVGKGHHPPTISESFILEDGRRVKPRICAVRRRKGEDRVEAIDILFEEAAQPHETSLMSPELAVLATTLLFSMRFRYQILERYVDRKIEGRDILAFNRALFDLQREAAADPRFAKDRALIRKMTTELFVGEDRVVVEKMYQRWDELYRPDGTGKMDHALISLDGNALAEIVKELIEMNQQFLAVTSRRFAELVVRT